MSLDVWNLTEFAILLTLIETVISVRNLSLGLQETSCEAKQCNEITCVETCQGNYEVS